MLLMVAYAEPAAQAPQKKATLGEREKLLYETECKRAGDLEQAYQALKAGLDDEHVIIVVFKDGKTVKRNHVVVSVQRFGAVLNLKFEQVDDEDVWYAESVQAYGIDHFMAVKKN